MKISNMNGVLLLLIHYDIRVGQLFLSKKNQLFGFPKSRDFILLDLSKQ